MAEANEEHQGITVRELLVKEGIALGFAEVRRLIHANCVLVDGAVVFDEHTKVSSGSEVTVGRNVIITYKG